MVSRTVDVVNKRGLHARASAKFVTLAAGLSAAVEVEKDGSKVCGTSIMGLMMLGAAYGDRITISATAKAPRKRWRRWRISSRPSSARNSASPDHRFFPSRW
jgi:phosphocarrier protein